MSSSEVRSTFYRAVFIVTVNHCCVVHDVCYTHQLGQERCDEQFCECNRVSSFLLFRGIISRSSVFIICFHIFFLGRLVGTRLIWEGEFILYHSTLPRLFLSTSYQDQPENAELHFLLRQIWIFR
ncbi:unnamed protein product [Haemonchus placei]|uniref:Uncharacterized protein n=1 Tax=Haemonchus placei TaxID=6290 RepID=A0A3P7VHT9_HAEPC|nr:unnamed protein product [Haemonchus placei]